MKTLRWIGRSITTVALGLIGKWLWSNFDSLPVFYSAYPTEILLGIFALILVISGLCFLEIDIFFDCPLTFPPEAPHLPDVGQGSASGRNPLPHGERRLVASGLVPDGNFLLSSNPKGYA